MPSPSVLDFEALIAPIPGDDPSGGPIPFTLRQVLDLARKDVRPEDFGPKDPLRPAEAKRADWKGIVEQTSQALTHSSKDLMLVARLIEGLACLHGFGGLRDGFRLARRMVEESWDRLRPMIEEPEDLEARAAAFHWLDDSDRGALFPTRLRSVPVLDGPISWSDWSLAAAGRGKVTVDEFEKAVQAASREDCQVVADDLNEAVDEFQKLLAALNEKMGQVSPGMTQLRQAVIDCQTLAKQILDKKGPAPGEAEAEAEGADGGEAGESGDGGPSGSPMAGAIRNRAQAYQKLNEIADALAVLEPHSPIPFVIRRAIALGQLSFPELMKELIADATVLGDMSRNLGIKELTGQG